jgi:preprotein translocase subunit YajC
VSGLLIIGVLFALMYVVMIRPQRAKAQQQQKMLGLVEPGDEVLTVGGIYGIVQELEPDEDGGDLVVEIAEGIHVRVARKALATVIKPDDGDDEDETETEGGDVVAGEAEPVVEDAEAPAGVSEVNGEEESVNPGTAEDTPPSGHS